MEDARLMGQSSYIFEVGSGLVIDGEVTLLTGDRHPREGETVHAQIAESGPPISAAALRGPARAAPPWSLDREVSHLFRGLVDVGEANDLLVQRATQASGSSTTGRSARSSAATT